MELRYNQQQINQFLLDWNNYLSFTDETAIYPVSTEFPGVYAVLGLIEETDELNDTVMARNLLDEVEADLINEAGDVMYYVARCFKDFALASLEVKDFGVIENYSPWLTNLKLGQIKKYYRDKNMDKLFDLRKKLVEIICIVWRLGNSCGVTINEVLELSKTKLLSRKERGVLKGDGGRR